MVIAIEINREDKNYLLIELIEVLVLSKDKNHLLNYLAVMAGKLKLQNH